MGTWLERCKYRRPFETNAKQFLFQNRELGVVFCMHFTTVSGLYTPIACHNYTAD
jgi:hypothetical protein